MKEEIKNSNDKVKFKPYIKQRCLIIWNVEKILRVKSQKLWKRRTEENWPYQKCAFCGSKKLRFIREQEAESILDNLGQVLFMPLRLLGI